MLIFPPKKQTGLKSSSPQTIRNHNESLITNLVWQHTGGISRTEIAKTLGLSSSTVWAIASDLIKVGILMEGETIPSKGGRPAKLLHFNYCGMHIIGIEMGVSHISIILSDLRGNILKSQEQSFDISNDPPGTLQLMGEMIESLQHAPEAQGPLLGIGIAVPSPLDSLNQGYLSPRLLPAWANTPLAQLVYQRFGAQVLIDNDANCGALAESILGAGQGVSDMTFIKIATGCGAGLIIDHKLFRGASGIAGEIGHTIVNSNGKQCRCGHQGCLEAEIGSPSLIDKARFELTQGNKSSLKNIPDLDLTHIVKAANEGDALALAITKEAGSYLGIAIANLLNIQNPALVVVGGLLSKTGEPLLQSIRHSVLERSFATSIERAKIEVSTFGDNTIPIGAATLVLEEALNNFYLLRTTHL